MKSRKKKASWKSNISPISISSSSTNKKSTKNFVINGELLVETKQRDFYSKINVNPTCNKYSYKHSIESSKWKIRIGNYVAVRSCGLQKSSSQINNTHKYDWDPFNESWCICQILSFFIERGNDSQNMLMEVRLIHRIHEFYQETSNIKIKSKTSKWGRNANQGYHTNIIQTIPVQHLLGFVLLVDPYDRLSGALQNDADVPILQFRNDYTLSFRKFRDIKMIDVSPNNDGNKIIQKRGTIHDSNDLGPWKYSTHIKKKNKQNLYKEAIQNLIFERSETFLDSSFVSLTPIIVPDIPFDNINSKEACRNNDCSTSVSSRFSKGRTNISLDSSLSSFHVSDTNRDISPVLKKTKLTTTKEAIDTPKKTRNTKEKPKAKTKPTIKPKKKTKSTIGIKKVSKSKLRPKSNMEVLKKTRNNDKIYLSQLPTYVNLSSGRAYYNFLERMLPEHNYVIQQDKEKSYTKRRWRVNVGDIALIEWKYDNNSNIVSREDMHPFNCQWCPIEIIAIWKKTSKSNAITLKNLITTSNNSSQEYEIHESKEEVMIEVRWLYLKSHLPRKLWRKISTETQRKHNHLDEVFESCHIDDCPALSLLSPARLFNPLDGESNILSNIERIMYNSSDSQPSIMPIMNFICHRFYYSNSNGSECLRSCGESSCRHERSWLYSNHMKQDPELKLIMSKQKQVKLDEIESKMIMSNQKQDKQEGQDENKLRLKMPNQVQIEKEEQDEMFEEDQHKIYTPANPFHANISSSRVYYKFLEFTPSYNNYIHLQYETKRETNETEKKCFLASKNNERWRVNVGDLVAVEFIDDKIYQDTSPFDCSWCPVEIIAIWKKTNKTDAARVLENADKTQFEDKELIQSEQVVIPSRERVMLEVRWFYLKSHLLSESIIKNIDDIQKYKKKWSDGSQLQEIFETDHVDDCTAHSLLCPIQLFNPDDENLTLPLKMKPVTFNPLNTDVYQIPTLNFLCCRFYSVQHHGGGSLMPFGELSNITERGLLYSNHMKKDLELKARMSSNGHSHVTNDASLSPIEKLKIKLGNAATRLTLSEASANTQKIGSYLKCREKEQGIIKEFVTDAIKRQGSSCTSMFVAGPPGTGKTASVLSVISQLRKDQVRGSLPDFEFCLINAMELRHPFDAYTVLWEAVSASISSKERKSPAVAASLLEKHFSTKMKAGQEQRPVTVLLLDEIDYLVTKDQTVLYNFFDWPLREGGVGKLVVVGISNTINLPDTLSPRVQSRLRGKRCIYQSYAVNQIVEIITERLSSSSDGHESCSSVFHKDAILFAARKTAGISGDIRKAFQVCRTAAENALLKLEDCNDDHSVSSTSAIIKMRDIQNATREMFNSRLLIALKNSTTFEALILVSLASLKRHADTGRGFLILEVLEKMEGLANTLGDSKYLPVPTFGELVEMLNRLSEVSYLI